MLLAARLSQPLALVNVAGWAEESGAEFFGASPPTSSTMIAWADALDAFFTQRHSILASVAAHVVHTFRLPMQRLHYDTTHLLFCGAYDGSTPIPDAPAFAAHDGLGRLPAGAHHPRLRRPRRQDDPRRASARSSMTSAPFPSLDTP